MTPLCAHPSTFFTPPYPTHQPTRQPTNQPTRQPSGQPTRRPSAFSLYNYKLPDVSYAASPSWVQVPQLAVTTIDFYASAWSAAGAGSGSGSGGSGSTPTPVCVMVGYNDYFGGILRSTNGGGFWSTVLLGTTTTGGLSTRFADVAAEPLSAPGAGVGTFLAVTLNGDIYVSSNNGASFASAGCPSTNDCPVPAQLHGVAIGGNGVGYAVGLSASFPYVAKVYRSYAISTFSAWEDITANLPGTLAKLLNAVATANGETVIAVGTGGTVLYSANNGSAWALSSYSTGPGTGTSTSTLQCVSMASGSVAMAAGDDATLILTTDGGASWTAITTFSPQAAAALAATTASASFRFHAIAMVSPRMAFVSASTGVVLRTLTQGAHWALDYALPAGTNGPQSVLSLSMANGYTGVAGFSRGGRVIARTWDAPTSQPTTQPTTTPTAQPTSVPTTHPTGYDVTGELTVSTGGVVWNAVSLAGTDAQNSYRAVAWGGDVNTVLAVGFQQTNGIISMFVTTVL